MAVLFAGVFVAVDAFVVDFFAVDFAGVDLVVVEALLVRLAVDFVAVALAGADFLAVVDLVAVDFVAVDFFAAALAGADLAVVDFFAVDFVAADFVAAFRVVDFFVPDALAAAVARPAVPVAAAGFVSRPNFFAPDTTFLNSCPGRNFGAVDFFTLMDWPVAGLRPVRAARCTFSKEPKPVMVTFSPLETER